MSCSDDELSISRLERAQNAPPFSGVGVDVDIETKEAYLHKRISEKAKEALKVALDIQKAIKQDLN